MVVAFFRRGSTTRGRLLIVDGLNNWRHRVEISVLSVGDEGLSIDALIVYGPTTRTVHYQRLAGLVVGLFFYGGGRLVSGPPRKKHVRDRIKLKLDSWRHLTCKREPEDAK